MTGTLDRQIEVEDVSLAMVRFTNRALGSIVNSVLSPREQTYLRFDFQQASVELTALYSYTNKHWCFSHENDSEYRSFIYPFADHQYLSFAF